MYAKCDGFRVAQTRPGIDPGFLEGVCVGGGEVRMYKCMGVQGGSTTPLTPSGSGH